MNTTELGVMLSGQARGRPAHPALTVRSGSSVTTVTWSQLADHAEACAAEAVRTRLGSAILPCDNGVAAVAALLGLLLAGVDVCVFEAGRPELRDPDAVRSATGIGTIVEPVSLLTAARSAPGSLSTAGWDRGADPTVLQLTSGSTGRPRFARQRLSGLLRGASLYRGIYSLTAADHLLATVPIAHSFGMVAGLFAAAVTGGHLTTFVRFSPRAVCASLDATDGASVMLGTPLVYELVSGVVRPASRQLRIALSSGGPIDPGTHTAAGAALCTPILQVYGSTETGLIAAQHPRALPWPPACVGHPAPGVECRIVDGRLLVRTSTMFDGYTGVTAPRSPDGYHEVGDAAELDGAGFLHLRSRQHTFINVGGRKVNPMRVQDRVDTFPHVRESEVYGARSLGGEEVHVAVVLEASGTVQGLIEHCRAGLAPYEVPHRVHLLSRLPRNGMGKIVRGQLPGV